MTRSSRTGSGLRGLWRSWGWRRVWPVGLALACGLLAPPARAQDNENDPLEPFNRAVFQVNLFLDRVILKPVAIMYRNVTPEFVREGVDNFLANLRTPVVLANDLLQGQFDRGELTLGRFMLNTIIGVGGLVDVGGMVGMPERHSEDFGQTLAVYGVGSGPYLMLPLLGPSNPARCRRPGGRSGVRPALLRGAGVGQHRPLRGSDGELPRAQHRDVR